MHNQPFLNLKIKIKNSWKHTTRQKFNFNLILPSTARMWKKMIKHVCLLAKISLKLWLIWREKKNTKIIFWQLFRCPTRNIFTYSCTLILKFKRKNKNRCYKYLLLSVFTYKIIAIRLKYFCFRWPFGRYSHSWKAFGWKQKWEEIISRVFGVNFIEWLITNKKAH